MTGLYAFIYRKFLIQGEAYMKLIHLSDLHLGKRVNELSMLEDQEYILNETLKIIDTEKPDGVMIAGDVYDKAVPPAEAVKLFDDFLVRLSKRQLQVYIISGNHDSPERLAFGGRLMELSGIHISPVYDGSVQPLSFDDEFGRVNIYLLPFIKDIHVKKYFPEAAINNYSDALRTVIDSMDINCDERNILAAHQYITNSERTGSEDIPLGGLDNVDPCVFEGFDYVALGHLHRPQNVDGERMRYCGSPLKYSFSEIRDQKSVTVVELGEKNNVTVRTVPLIPLRDMKEIKGKYDDITLRSYYENTSYQEDYIHIILTDENDVYNAVGKLRSIYHNLMKIDYENSRTLHSSEIKEVKIEQKTPLELFAELFKMQNGREMTGEQEDFIREALEEIQETGRTGVL